MNQNDRTGSLKFWLSRLISQFELSFSECLKYSYNTDSVTSFLPPIREYLQLLVFPESPIMKIVD
jgi:hypothetical protein